MICPQCKTPNPIGSKFCRECGARLQTPEDALAVEEAARVETERREERVAALLADGIALSERGKPYEALPLVEEAARLLPASTSAQALLASLYERTGQTKKAITAMEAVVALNPESEADRTKLEQLRRGVHVGPVPVRPAGALPAWAPIAIAGAVGAFVLGVGLSLVLSDPDRRPDGRENRVAVSTPGSYYAPVSPGAGSALLPGPAPTTVDVAPPPVRPDPFAPVPGEPDPGASAPAPSTPRATTGAARRAGREASASTALALPPPGEGSTKDAAVPPRYRYRPATGASSARQSSPRSLPALDGGSATAGERIRVAPPSAAAGAFPMPLAPPAPTAARIEERAPSGYIRIRVSPPRQQESPAPPSPAAPIEIETDPLSRAQSLQAAGRYREAATAYGQAAGSLSGAAAGEAYQAMALCQQRLGDDAAARAAYRQAIAAYEAQAASGREVSAARQGIASCRAALEVLGNG